MESYYLIDPEFLLGMIKKKVLETVAQHCEYIECHCFFTLKRGLRGWNTRAHAHTSPRPNWMNPRSTGIVSY